MREIETLIIGGGVTGLAVAALLGRDADCLVLEAEPELGGYCRTIEKDGFVWDYSGHFFHFREPRVEQWLRARMDGEVRAVRKRSFIHYGDRRVDFPFQKNVHQLPQGEFVECLHDLYFAEQQQRQAPNALVPGNFREMLYARYGRAIAEKFLIPYNEKLYATPLDALDRDAMGRFFPHAKFEDVLRNMRTPDDASYNQTFTYPRRGAQAYVAALANEIAPDRIRLGERVTRLELEQRTVETTTGRYRFDRLVNTAPLPRLLELCGRDEEAASLSWNQVLVFNLGFDRKGPGDTHWIYFPQRELPFYRVGFYDNIFETERMSLYVELGFDRHARPDATTLMTEVLEGLRRAGIVTDQALVASHSVLLNPAYVHITQRSTALVGKLAAELTSFGVSSLGRYGRWTYCSIEDNLLEAEAWVARHAPSAKRFE